MAFNKTQLLNSANLIRGAKTEAFNTAERVGKMFVDIINETESAISAETAARNQVITQIQTQLLTAQQTATNAQTAATNAGNAASNAQSTANTAKSLAEAAKSVTDTKGLPNGIAPLDANAKIPAANLPGFVDDVVEFNAMVSGVTPQLTSVTKNSTDLGCMVVYDKDHDTFLLAVSNKAVVDSVQWGGVLRPLKTLNTPAAAIEIGETNTLVIGDYWQIKDSVVNLKVSEFTYYNDWLDGASFGTTSSDGRVPEGGKVYICTSDNKTFRWSGSELVTIGSDLAIGYTAGCAFPGDEGMRLKERVSGINIYPFDTICYHPESELGDYPDGTIAFAVDNHRFVLKQDGDYIQHPEYNIFLNGVGSPKTDRIYRQGDTLYVLRRSTQGYYYPTAYVIGSEKFDEITETVNGIAILPIDGIIPYDANKTFHPFSGIWFRTLQNGEGYFEEFGDNAGVSHLTNYNDTTASGHVARQDKIFRLQNELYRYNGAKFLKVGGASVGNTYNVTVENPLESGEYYSDLKSETQTHNVLDAVIAAGHKSLGLTITFAIGAGSWKTYQYVGPNTSDTQFRTLANWIDMAGMSAGTEAVVNVDDLCPRSEQGLSGFYDKGSAIDAILSKQNASGIIYAKSGLVITFRSAEYTWQAYQFTGEVTDFSNKDLWKEFGGGGSVKTSDTPEDGGKDAFSTGGAYEMDKKSFAGLEIVPDPDDYIIQGVDKTGAPIGEAVNIPKSNGAGQVSGSTLSIYLENPAIYAAFGSEIVANAAIKSVTYDGDTEVLGVIRRLEIIDATTGLVLWGENVNQNSSTSATNYTFKFDFTSYFSEAAQRDFTIVAYDAEGNVKRRTITVTAVDVTCTSVQTLNYTTSSVLEVNGSSKNLLMYKFANNVSKQGVKVLTEIYLNGEWKKLGEATITDSYSHSISIDPCNVLGGNEKLAHGSYPIRISGTDVASGVKGNVVYSSVMCVDPKSSVPIVAMRYNDVNNGVIRLYDNLEIEIAAYTPGKEPTTVQVFMNGDEIISNDCYISQTYPIRKQIQGFDPDGSATIQFYAKSGNSQTNTISLQVVGSAISAIIKEGALFGFDFASRSNSEADHTIANNGYTMAVIGSNWSSNGFATYLGENCLRIAENVKASIPFAPFGSAATERTNGMAFQFAFATNNIKYDEAKLMECYDPESGAGFYVCGNKLVVTCKNGTPSTITRSFKCGEKHTVGIVVEPSTITVKRGSTDYSAIKIYMDGEEISAIGYVANSGAILNQKNISFDGTDGDFYLYYTLAYDSYYEWAQAFQNYLCKLTDTDAMIEEFEAENVLDNQNRPSMDLLKDKGFPYYVVVAPQATFDSFDADIDTKTNFKCTLYYFHPTMPWRSFKAENVRWRRQGTTSAKRPIKNDRFYLCKEKNWKITALNPDYTNADALKTYELFDIGYVRVGESTIPVAIITVKVDYSDSSMANDCGVCDMMNATFRALGSDYITPAQRAFDGKWSKKGVSVTGLQMNHSTANHPIAAFRATTDSLSDAWFHARGNWKEDKGEQVALGFQDTSGYNLGCKNYGDFIEFFGKATFDAAGKFQSQETLTDIMARFKATEGLDTSKLYLLSQYCGRDYIFMRYSGGEWARANGSMKQVNGKWVIEGDVLNPVSGYELITYDAMDWFMGVGSIDDMMAPVETQSSWVSKLSLGQQTYPAWTQYFECMIDNDQLQEDLAMGRKVPYELFNVLKFCDSCDYSKTALANTWKQLWRENAWKYMSIQSLIAYYTFTDYLAAVDQQAKNMQPMFFLEDGCWVENGVYHSPSAMEPIRMYFNKVYDCDTCNGKDNDGGNTIPAELDPAEDDKCYAGRGSILWNNLRRCDNQEMVANAAGGTLTLPGVVGLMRNLPEVYGIGAGPFSPKGALYYFVQKRIEFWPKVVCTYDCERKYIKYSELYTDIYYYALHGSGRQSLPRFIEQRWRIRDGYYQTGDFKDASHVLGGRIGAKTGAVIRFRAGKAGYYGIGNDGGNVTQGMYLKAGQQGTFTNFQHGDNILLYIYQADQMSEIDLSQISLDPNFQFSQMKLAEKIVIGSVNHRQSWRLSPGNTGFLTNMNLGDLPFLTHLDVRTTEVTNINAARCPRLETVLASGSDLTSISTAETSPISTLELPASMTELNFVNLPNLSYPGGLTIEGMNNVIRLMLAGCPNIDPMTLINGLVTSSNIRYIRLPNVNITAPSSILTALKNSGAIGLDPTGSAYEESNQCSGITGRWIMEDLIEDSLLDSFGRYFPQLTLHNSQYSTVVYSDTVDDCENITNHENQTGYLYNKAYVPSGHFKRLEEMSKAVRGTYVDGVMHCVSLSDEDYNFLADGTSIDLTDSSGMGYDFYKHIPNQWYKGVNDFKNQVKYGLRSMCKERPIATYQKINRKKLSEILVEANAALILSNNAVGSTPTRTLNANMNVYEIDVQGMKQVRWPGINSAELGSVFLDADGKIISTFKMANSTAQFDFMPGEDYIFTDVPGGAVKFQFTSQRNCDNQEAIAVDSAAIEAIEPDWVFRKEDLVGIYGLGIDGLGRPRSISGTKAQVGDGNSTTSSAWTYDATGKVTNAEAPTGLHRTRQDFINLCEMRGSGFHAISYEQSKDLANIIMELVGNRDIQAVCGRGCSAGYTCGAQTINGKNINAWGNCTLVNSASGVGNLMFGIQNFVACNYEWMAHVAVNVTSFKDWKAKKCPTDDSSYPTDARWHIYNCVDDTEREVQGINASDRCIGRVRYGRFMDVVPSKLTNDNSQWNKNYSDVFYYTHAHCRVVGRAFSYANANGGLVCAYAGSVSTGSGSNYGSRLAFSGPIVFDDDTEEVNEAA